jgi:hypothetical protein
MSVTGRFPATTPVFAQRWTVFAQAFPFTAKPWQQYQLLDVGML